ncbi:MAG: cytochrome c [Steroidobacteraceae bacterium]
MHFRLTALLGWGLMLCALLGSAHAEGDAKRGKELAYTCHGCHGIPNYKNAAPVYSVPKLGGQQAAYMIAALKEYASGDRAHPTMHAHAASNNEQDRADMAAFFAGQGPRKAPVVGTPPPAAQVCTACHGNDGHAVAADYPTLAGQHADYLTQALRDYKSGKRKNAVMAGIVGSLADKDIEPVAAFYAKQPGLCDTKQILNNGGQCKQ